MRNHLFLAPTGQQIGHGPDPRYLCPRLQVFPPLLLFADIDFFFVAMGAALPQIQAGKLTALAVNGAWRSPALPTVPTTREAGFDNAEYPTWFGLFLSAKTPREIVDKLHRETLKALQEPMVRDKLAKLGVEPMVMASSQFDAHVEKEIAVNAALVKAIGMKAR